MHEVWEYILMVLLIGFIFYYLKEQEIQNWNAKYSLKDSKNEQKSKS